MSKIKAWSKKKKILFAVLMVVLFLFVAIIVGGIVALNWYCDPGEYEVASSQYVATSDTELIAHRGFRSVAPENTVPAFIEAGKRNMYGAECDVYMTKDGKWVVQHDPNIFRMMNGVKNIEKMTYDELLEYDNDNGIAIDKYPNLKVCTLDEYLDVCDEYHMVAYIEIKGKNNVEHYDKIVESVSAHKSPIVYISFNEENLLAMRKLTDAPMSYLVHEIKPESIEIAKKIGNCGIDFNASKEKNYENNGEMIKNCQDEGLELTAWTVDDLETMQRLVDFGVEYITTDCITY